MNHNFVRKAFITHSIMDWFLGAVLLVVPSAALSIAGWPPIDPLAARLIGAALIGFGTATWIVRNGTLRDMRATAITALAWNMPAFVVLDIAAFHGLRAAILPALILAVFCFLWIHVITRAHS